MSNDSFQPTIDQRETPTDIPLCTDLDGTLITTDLLFESLLLLGKQQPWALLLVPFWFLLGRAALKRRIAERIYFDPSTLPYNEAVLDYLQKQKREGRTIVLATASDQILADALARHLGIFDIVLGSDGKRNLKGSKKSELLEQHFGRGAFDYIGDSAADIHIWRSSANAIVVARNDSFPKKAAKAGNVIKILARVRTSRTKALLKALRLHHWSKNILLFLPLMLAHQIKDPVRLKEAVIAFFCFGFAASAIYVLNDLLDLQSDRKHPWKSRRPFASSALSIPFGVCLFGVLATGSLIASWFFLTWFFTIILACYLLLSIVYSTSMKSVLLVDVMLLTSFYGLRILAGGIAVHVKFSYWLIAFAMFFFFSLAMAKRYSELVHAADLIESGNSGRAYVPEDRIAVSSFGIASGYISILVIAFYINSHEVTSLYQRPEVLWLICPLVLYWVSRIWLLAHRELLADDPVVIAMRDKVSYAAGLFAIAIVLAAGPMS